jgi:transcriptional regulator with XRE-family HTH domain
MTDRQWLEHTGEALRRIRTDRKMLQGDVAKAAGITRPMLSAYERGRVVPKLETLQQVLSVMGVSLDVLARYIDLVIEGLQADGSAPWEPPIISEGAARSALHGALDQWANAVQREAKEAARQEIKAHLEANA